LKLLEKIRESHADLPVLMVSAYENPTYVARAVALGANDYVLKSEAGEKIVAAINLAVKGHPPLAGGLWHRIRSLMQSGEVPSSFPQQTPLTSREVQVFRHIGLGLSNREIARSLQISVETVKEHVQHLLRKVDASDRTEAAVNAVRFGLINY
jgi:DNA-binding NarL/FixJ family response regulator